MMESKTGYSESVVFVVALMKFVRIFGAEGQVSDKVVVYARLVDGAMVHRSWLKAY